MGLPTGSQYISYIGMAWMMPDGRAQMIIVFERHWGRLQNTSQKRVIGILLAVRTIRQQEHFLVF